MNTHVILFTPTGTGQCLWTDALPLPELGLLEVNRASFIEFNSSAQIWEVRLAVAPQTVVFSHPSRQVCLEWEKHTLNALL